MDDFFQKTGIADAQISRNLEIEIALARLLQSLSRGGILELVRAYI